MGKEKYVPFLIDITCRGIGIAFENYLKYLMKTQWGILKFKRSKNNLTFSGAIHYVNKMDIDYVI